MNHNWSVQFIVASFVCVDVNFAAIQLLTKLTLLVCDFLDLLIEAFYWISAIGSLELPLFFAALFCFLFRNSVRLGLPLVGLSISIGRFIVGIIIAVNVNL